LIVFLGAHAPQFQVHGLFFLDLIKNGTGLKGRLSFLGSLRSKSDELEAQIDERAREKEMQRQAEEERKRESVEARQRILQQIEAAKAVSGGWRGGAEGGGGAHALDSLTYLHRSFQPPEARRNSVS